MYPLVRPDLAELIDGALGAQSDFDARFGYYADGVGPETAILPDGWQDRLVAVESSATGEGRGLCLERNDLAVSKLAAGREKNLYFVEAMLRYNLTDIATLRERLTVPRRLEPARRPVIDRWLTARDPSKT